MQSPGSSTDLNAVFWRIESGSWLLTNNNYLGQIFFFFKLLLVFVILRLAIRLFWIAL